MSQLVKIEFTEGYAEVYIFWVAFQVGYLLGLGDRHPGNIMLHQYRYNSNEAWKSIELQFQSMT